MNKASDDITNGAIAGFKRENDNDMSRRTSHLHKSSYIGHISFLLRDYIKGMPRLILDTIVDSSCRVPEKRKLYLKLRQDKAGNDKTKPRRETLEGS